MYQCFRFFNSKILKCLIIKFIKFPFVHL
jgi:hypothetical protein